MKVFRLTKEEQIYIMEESMKYSKSNYEKVRYLFSKAGDYLFDIENVIQVYKSLVKKCE